MSRRLFKRALHTDLAIMILWLLVFHSYRMLLPLAANGALPVVALQDPADEVSPEPVGLISTLKP